MPDNVRLVVKTDEVRRYLNRLDREAIPKSLRKHWNGVGRHAANAVRAGIPGRDAKTHRTGNLRASVRYKVFAYRSTNNIGIIVAPMGRKGSHRHLVEYGTQPASGKVRAAHGWGTKAPYGWAAMHTAGHPYVNSSRDKAERILSEGIDAAIDEAIRGL
jgi:hypothetical protein